MAKRFALYFGVVGYLLVIWHDAFRFAPLSSTFASEWLQHACFGCIEVTGGVSWWGALLVAAPVEGLIYGMVGFLIGKAIQKRVATSRLV